MCPLRRLSERSKYSRHGSSNKEAGMLPFIWFPARLKSRKFLRFLKAACYKQTTLNRNNCGTYPKDKKHEQHTRMLRISYVCTNILKSAAQTGFVKIYDFKRSQFTKRFQDIILDQAVAAKVEIAKLSQSFKTWVKVLMKYEQGFLARSTGKRSSQAHSCLGMYILTIEVLKKSGIPR